MFLFSLIASVLMAMFVLLIFAPTGNPHTKAVVNVRHTGYGLLSTQPTTDNPGYVDALRIRVLGMIFIIIVFAMLIAGVIILNIFISLHYYHCLP